MKAQIQKLIQEKPKHFSAMIQRNPEMKAWVLDNSVQTENFAERVFDALYHEPKVCPNGNNKKFHGIKQGYINCGQAGKCQCAKEQVSKSVSETKGKISKEDKLETNEKRKVTNLKKYGVEYTTTLPSAKRIHKEFYADPVKVSMALEKYKQTMMENHGCENPRGMSDDRDKRTKTLMRRYGENVTNPAHIPSVQQRQKENIAKRDFVSIGLLAGFKKLTNGIEEKYNFQTITPFENYLGCCKGKLTFKCNKCGAETTQRFWHARGLNCDICSPKQPSFTSGEEQEVYDFITKELGILNGRQGDKSLINPFELDMVFPEQKIAVEYSGLYWHSECSSGKKAAYHQEKMNKTNDKGYRLVTIFSDEWNLHIEKVKDRLRNIFGKTSKKYFARKLEIREVTFKESKSFLIKHHLQNNSVAPIRLGLYVPGEDNLLALMTFSKGRVAMNTKSEEGIYELVRFVTNGSSIVGGASKLLKHFQRTFSPNKIITYADLRWSQGKLYETIGFTKTGKPSPGYWYVEGYTTRIHRYNFTKHSLVKKGANIRKTEWEIMQELGYDRIWDCGHQKYELVV